MSIDHTTDRKSETYTGRDVVGPDADSVGKATDVIYDDTTNAPTWLVVNPGVLQSDRYVPVEGSSITDKGDIVVPFDKKHVKASPKATGDHVLDDQLVHALVDHYSVHPG